MKPTFKRGLFEILRIKNNFVLKMYQLDKNIIKLIIKFVEPTSTLSLRKSKRLKTFIKNIFGQTRSNELFSINWVPIKMYNN